MANGGAKQRQSWADRFRTPTCDILLGEVPRPFAAALQHARTKFLAIPGVREVVSWLGVWNWTLAYERGQEGEPAMAYIVPDPSRPRVCITISEACLPDLANRRLSKQVRDAIVFAPVVKAVRWPVWDIDSRAQIDELSELLTYRLAYEHGALTGS